MGTSPSHRTTWTSAPTRRELTILLFSLSIFVLFYNLDSTLHLFGISSPSHSSSLFHFSPKESDTGGSSGASAALPIGPDGRVPEPYRDALEKEIFGEWEWEEGRIAGVKEAEEERITDKEGWIGDKDKASGGGKGKGKGKAGEDGRDRYVNGEGITGEKSKWLQGVSEGKYLFSQDEKDAGLTGVASLDLVRNWTSESVPRTKVVKHLPGYTILDTVIMANGTMYIVTDSPSSIPPLDTIASSLSNPNEPPGSDDWQIVSPEEGISMFGTYGGRMHGVTYLAYDTPQTHSPLTLLSLHRLYTSLSFRSSDLSPPHRLLFPSLPTFPQKLLVTDPNIPTHPRYFPANIHPFTLKAAYPTLAGVLFKEDWDDFVDMVTPVVMDRVVVGDRGAASRARTSVGDVNGNGIGGDRLWADDMNGMSEVGTSWFESIRQNLVGMVGEGSSGESGSKKVVVTYLANQGGVEGRAGKLSDEDHRALVQGLKGLSGVKVNVIESQQWPWKQRMAEIAGSTVIIGPHGEHLTDSIFMKRPQSQGRSPASTLVELFPSESFNDERATLVKSVGINYLAFAGATKYTKDALPPISREGDVTATVSGVDVKAVVQAVKEELARRS